PDARAALCFVAALTTALVLAVLGRGAMRLVGAGPHPLPEADMLVGWGLSTAFIVTVGTLTDIGLTAVLTV
ncbi:MAG: hypothetical protein J0626_06870, partial [Rhodospirillaceae bacterium]|nr:hypothetical protein [Rhodospirillaceae bacterium]